MVRFRDVDLIILEVHGKHFEVDPHERKVKYRNVISPRDGGMNFPDGYFCEKEVSVPQSTMIQISSAFDAMASCVTWREKIAHLPPGAGHEAYMRVFSAGCHLYYFNVYYCEDANKIEREPIASEFLRIVNLLEPYCSFPEYKPIGTPFVLPNELEQKIYADLEIEEPEKYIGYRFEATGVFGYRFYKADEQICSVSSIIAPSAPVMIHSHERSWRSDFDAEGTIVPGLFRTVQDEESGEEITKIIYRARGEYDIGRAYQVYCGLERYAFYHEGKKVSEIRRARAEEGHLRGMTNAGEPLEPYYEIYADRDISAEMLMVFLAFPMLQFAL